MAEPEFELETGAGACSCAERPDRNRGRRAGLMLAVFAEGPVCGDGACLARAAERASRRLPLRSRPSRPSSRPIPSPLRSRHSD